MSDLEQTHLLHLLPHAPYPGLRPFLDHEDMLMYGRSGQVEDIVRRLGHGVHAAPDEPASHPLPDDGAAPDGGAPLTRFVAVIGGSGSGKSSLIRAGVVPFLRQFGIPEVGDLWRAIVFTPGTNFVPREGAAIETPITRLAWKFEAALGGERSAQRRDAIALLLRRPGGLGRAVDAYGPQLAVPASVRAENACVLIVIDQFEELFHKSNQAMAEVRDDTRALIERVIDHYHQAKTGSGSPHCFVAITMRSEHLNDCAGYIGLPEAINAGAYLVSRLDDAEVREVIEKPAQRFLRLRQRERRGDATLPRSVAFEPAVIDRLVADTHDIAHDPDHLPLLQHALARMWQAACEREAVAAGGVPAQVVLADLWRAATAADVGVEPPEPGNVLRLSLDRWPDRTFLSHPAAEQAALTALLRRLAYKDPTTGTYNQQRIYVATHPLGEDALHALVGGRWIHAVNYLYWDDDNPDKVTLKVSHESFIRGWLRFRQLVDAEALRFERFVALLSACSDWADAGRRDDDLLDQRLLRRMEDAEVEAALAPAAAMPREGGKIDAQAGTAWDDWQAWLGRTPLGQPLQHVSRADARDFYQRSRQRLEREKGREKARAQTVAALFTGLAGLAIMVLLVVGFAQMVQTPVLERSRLFFQAADAANMATLRNAWPTIGGGEIELDQLLKAARNFERARSGDGTTFAGVSDALLHGRWSPLQGLPIGSVLPLAAHAIEPAVNGKLRITLTRALWRTAAAVPTDQQLVDAQANAPILDQRCGEQTGMLLPVEGQREGDRSRRGVFVGDSAIGGNRLMFSATLTDHAACELGTQIAALPADRQPAALFDASLVHLLLATDGATADGKPASGQGTVTVSRLQWDDPDSGERAELLPPLAVVFDDKTAQTLRRQVRQTMGMAAATWRMPGGRAIRVDQEAWRIVADVAQRLVPQPRPEEMLAVVPANDRPCVAVGQAVQTELDRDSEGGFRAKVFREDDYCLAILQGRPPGATPASTRELVHLRAYARPHDDDLDATGRLVGAPISISSVVFGRLPKGPVEWLAGAGGYKGWLVVHRPKDEHNPDRYLGLPWSTAALERLGTEVLDEHRRQAAAGSASLVPVAAGGSR